MAGSPVLAEGGFPLSKKSIAKVVSEAMRTPFVSLGREVGKGLDCWGLVHHISKESFDMDVPDFRVDALDKNKIFFQFLQAIEEEYYEVDRKDVQPGDVVALNMVISQPDLVQHFGIMIDDKKFVHTLQKSGPHLTKLTDIGYKNRIRGFYRWKGKNSDD